MDFNVDDVVVVVDWSGRREPAPLAAACATVAADHVCGPGHASSRWRGLLLDAPFIAIAAAARQAPTGELPHRAGDLTVVTGERVGERDGRYQAVTWDAGREELSVQGDVVGAVPLYVWRSGDLLVLASALKAFRPLPFVPDVDPDGLAAIVTLGFPLGASTLLRGVSAVPPDAVVRFTRSGTSVQPKRSIAPGEEVSPGFARGRADEIVDAFDATLAAGAAAWLRRRHAPLVSLSGGLDSRLALAYVVAAGAKPTAATWGVANAGDVRIASRVAAVLGVPHRTVPLDIATPWTAAEFAVSGWRLETFGAVALPFYAREWARFLATQGGRPSVHGFIGDTLGGANLLMYGVDAAAVAGPAHGAEAALHTWIRHRVREKLAPFATPAFASRVWDTVPDAALAQYRALSDAHAYQRLLWFDLLTRQRRYVACSASNLLAAYGPVVLPFYTVAQIELALRLPADALLYRAAARRLLVRRFPALARIPLTGETALPAYADRKHEWIDWPGRLIRARRRHWVRMFRTFGTLLGAHRHVVVATLRQAAPMLEAHLDVEALCTHVDEVCAKASPRGVPQADRRFFMRILNVATFLTALTERTDAPSAGPVDITG